MNTLYTVIGVIILLMGIVTYYRPRTVRYISLSQRPHTTSMLTLALGIIMIIVGLIA